MKATKEQTELAEVQARLAWWRGRYGFSSTINLIHFLRQNRSTWLPMILDKRKPQQRDSDPAAAADGWCWWVLLV